MDSVWGARLAPKSCDNTCSEVTESEQNIYLSMGIEDSLVADLLNIQTKSLATGTAPFLFQVVANTWPGAGEPVVSVWVARLVPNSCDNTCSEVTESEQECS